MTKKQSKPTGAPPWKQQQKEAARTKRAEERQKGAGSRSAGANTGGHIAGNAETTLACAPRQLIETRNQYCFLNLYSSVRYLPRAENRSQ